MNKEKEKEQLLQDASTLLMFANVARQGLGLPGDSPTDQNKTSSPQEANQPNPSGQPHSGGSSVSTTLKNSPTQGATESPSIPQKSPSQIPSQTPSGPQLSPSQPAVRSPPQLRHGSWNTPLGSQSHLLPGSGSLPPALPNRGYFPYVYSGSSHYGPGLQQPPQQLPHLGHSPQSSEAKIPSIANILSYPKLEESAAIKQEPKDSANVKSPPLDSGKPQSPSQGNLPAQGSFQTHRRSTSGGFSSSGHSPGAAKVALSRGINVETGKRSTDNAVIVAAALAAAADIPLPLKRKEEETKPEDTSKAPATKDDSVVTEPEDDNKTDDETIPENTPRTGAVAAFPSTSTQPRVNRPVTPPSPQQEPPKPLTLNDGSLETAKAIGLTSSEHAAAVQPKEEQEPHSTTNYRPPPLHLYKVDPDSGIIGCICGIEEDDGFTIQCDVCFRWQHCSCMGYRTNEEVPEDEYKCYYCDERKWNKFNPDTCRKDTLARLELEKASELATSKSLPGKRKASGSNGEDKKKRKTEKDAKPAVATSSEVRPGNSKRKSSGNLAAANVTPASPGVLDIPLKNNDLLEDGVTAETYQSVYYKLKDYDYKTPSVKRNLELLGAEFEKSSQRSLAIETVPLASYKSTKFSKVILPIHQRYLQEKNELQKNKGYNKTAVQVKPYSENPKHKFTGVQKVGLYITERAATPGADTTIPAGTNVIEYLGEVDFFDLYKANHANQYSLWGAVKPKVAVVDLKLFENQPPVQVVIDARFVGNESRFIRKSCPNAANCEIRPVYIPQLRSFKFFVVTTKPITLKGDTMDEELRIAWEWDDLHPIKQMVPATESADIKDCKKFEDFDEDLKFLLISCVDAILNFTECGCNTAPSTSQCAIFKIKKATSYLLRSTRKASGLSNTSLSKSKEVLMMPQQVKEFVSWKERLVERDGKLHAALFSLTPSDESSEISSEDDPALERSATPGVQSVADVTVEKAVRDKSSFFRVPFKKQLLSRGHFYPNNGRTIEYSTEEKTAGDTKEADGSRVLAIPIVPEILSLIRDTVNETLKPLARITSDVKVSVDSTERKESVGGQEKENVPVELATSRSEEVVEPVTKTPAVVKKLSFADYKKKMK